MNPLQPRQKRIRTSLDPVALEPRAPPAEARLPAFRGPPIYPEVSLVHRAAADQGVVEIEAGEPYHQLGRAPAFGWQHAAGMPRDAVIGPRLAGQDPAARE